MPAGDSHMCACTGSTNIPKCTLLPLEELHALHHTLAVYARKATPLETFERFMMLAPRRRALLGESTLPPAAFKGDARLATCNKAG